MADFIKDDGAPLTKNPSKKLSNSGKLLIAATGGVAIAVSVVCASFVMPALRKYCLPFVPATNEQIKNVLHFVPRKPRSSERLLDIGSGDGRIVIAAAQHGIKADGCELNFWLVLYSKFAAMRQGVRGSTHFFRKDLWKFDLSPYNYIVIFGVQQMMNDLEKKLIAEAPVDGKVIACRFPLPNLKPQNVIEDGVDTVWFYDLKKSRERSL